MDPDALKAFVSVVEQGGFTRAAQSLNRTQAAVSQQIKKLEDGLGRRLFDRHSRRVELTSYGRVLLGYARQLLALQDEAITALTGQELEGTIKLGTPDDYATCFLPPIINSFAREHPLAEVEVQCELSSDLMELLQDRKIDLALVTRQSGDRSGELVRREPLVWAVAPGSTAHLREQVPLALFASTNSNCMFRDGCLAVLDQYQRAYRIVYSSLSMAVLTSAVRAGLAVTVLARSTVPSDFLILGEADGMPPLPDVEIALLRRPGKRPDVVNRFGDHIVQTIAYENAPEL